VNGECEEIWIDVIMAYLNVSLWHSCCSENKDTAIPFQWAIARVTRVVKT